MKNFIGAYARLPVHGRRTFLRNMSIHRNVTERYNAIGEWLDGFQMELDKAVKAVKKIKSVVKDIETNGADKKTVAAVLEKFPNIEIPKRILETVPLIKKPGDIFSKDLLNIVYRSEQVRDKLKFVKFVKDADLDFTRETPKEALMTFIFNMQGIHNFIAFITAGGEEKVLPDEAYDVVEDYNDMLNDLEKLLEGMGIERKGIPVDRLLSVTSPEAVTKLMEIDANLYKDLDAIAPAVNRVLNNPWTSSKSIEELLTIAKGARRDMRILKKVDKVLSKANGFSYKIIDALR